MKSESEIQARIAFLRERSAHPKTKRAAHPILGSAEDALAWVLGTNDEDMSLQRTFDDELGA